MSVDTVIAWIAVIVSELGDMGTSDMGSAKVGASAADSLDTSACKMIPFISATDVVRLTFAAGLDEGDDVFPSSPLALLERFAEVGARALLLLLLLAALLLFFSMFGR